ncbi:hypothetical protein ACFL2V_18250 [Pseudomonadota bacterium]
MSKRRNHRKESFLNSIPTASLDSKEDRLALKCKFNFSYIDTTQAPPGQVFRDMTHEQLCSLMEKLKNFGKDSLKHWATQRIGGGGLRVFSIYGNFPKRSDFAHPAHVPHQANWARFRLEGDLRLVGFIVPNSYHGTVCKHTKERFDENTFYVVFIDPNHNFYKTK